MSAQVLPTSSDPFYTQISNLDGTDFLFTFKKQPASYLEAHEKLEQLRAIENGYRIKAIETKFETVGVDTPADLELARVLMQKEKNA